jgi:uncharacterized membrane protein (DUF373 family)
VIRPPRRHGTRDLYTKIPNPLRRLALRVLDALDLLVYALVGIAFIGAAVLALGYSLAHVLVNFGVALPLNGVVEDVLTFVSDLLLVLIIMEVLGTVRSYLERGDTSVKPFLFIGIISATRGILSIGARLSIQGTQLNLGEFQNSMIELAIDAFVIIALGVTIRILGAAADLPEEAESEGSRTEVTAINERIVVETSIPAHASHGAHPAPSAVEPSPQA